jgi:protein O-mannosyl-transferase
MLWISLALIALVALNWVVYAPLGHFDFVKWDDPQYITDNATVLAGLTWHGVAWAFTSTHGPYWHPLTWLSHMLDVQLFGLDAGGHHITNIVLHIATTLLLFGLLRRTTGALMRSAFVAALFAVHPLHVESVAWIAERKDVLSALFWMLTLWAYGWYAARPGVRRYLAVMLLFACGLMAKPMVVTLPFALLLVDVWPLGRLTRGAIHRTAGWSRLVTEKLPLIALAAAVGAATFVLQRGQGALPALEAIPLKLRVANALTSYVAYIGLMFWPAHLAALYPYPRALPAWWAIAGAALILAGISGVAIRTARRHPYVLVGWLWYLGTLVPVIGLIQSGEQSMADRFVYIPLVGLFVIVAWGIPDLPDGIVRWPERRVALPVAAAIAIVACAVVARRQVQYWADNLTLWEHVVSATGPNYRAQGNLAMALQDAGRTGDAIAHYSEALRINPRFLDAYDNLGLALASEGRTDEAIALYAKTLGLKPTDADAHNNLGKLLAEQGKVGDAVAHFSEAVRLKPQFSEAHNNLANALATEGKLREAIDEYTEALRLQPDFADAHNGLGGALVTQGRVAEAVPRFEEAVRLDPNFLPARHNLAAVLARQGKIDEAARQLEIALQIDPNDETARRGLAALKSRGGSKN